MLKKWVGLYAGLCLAFVLTDGGATAEEITFPPQTQQPQDLDLSPADELNRTIRILRTTNKAQINRYVPKVYDFKNVNPFAVLRFIKRPVEAAPADGIHIPSSLDRAAGTIGRLLILGFQKSELVDQVWAGPEGQEPGSRPAQR